MRKTFFAACLIVLASLQAAAQSETPKAELSGGYSYAGEGSRGFDASVAVSVKRWLGLAADFGGQYTQLEEAGVRERIRTHSFLFGPRVSARGGRATGFAHALLGASHVNSEAVELGQTFNFSDTGFAAALGGGLDLNVNDRFAVRVIQADYLRTHFFGAAQNEGRVVAGVVFRFGTK